MLRRVGLVGSAVHEDRVGLLCSELPLVQGLVFECYAWVSIELKLRIVRREAMSQKKRLKNRLCRGAIKDTGLFSLKKERLGRSDNIIQQLKELPRGRGWGRFWITLRVWLGRIDRNQGQSRFQLYTVRTSELSELLERGRAERACQLGAPGHTACPVSSAGPRRISD